MPRETIQAKSNFQLSTIRNLKTSILEEANTQERYTKVLKRAASSRSTFRESSPLLVARQPLDRVLEENGRRAQVGRPLYLPPRIDTSAGVRRMGGTNRRE